MRKFFVAIFLVALNTVPVIANESEPLNTSAIRTLLVGKTFLGNYPDGLHWRETYLVDDSVDYRDANHRLSGKLYRLL